MDNENLNFPNMSDLGGGTEPSKSTEGKKSNLLKIVVGATLAVVAVAAGYFTMFYESAERPPSLEIEGTQGYIAATGDLGFSFDVSDLERTAGMSASTARSKSVPYFYADKDMTVKEIIDSVDPATTLKMQFIHYNSQDGKFYLYPLGIYERLSTQQKEELVEELKNDVDNSLVDDPRLDLREYNVPAGSVYWLFANQDFGTWDISSVSDDFSSLGFSLVDKDPGWYLQAMDLDELKTVYSECPNGVRSIWAYQGAPSSVTDLEFKRLDLDNLAMEDGANLVWINHKFESGRTCQAVSESSSGSDNSGSSADGSTTSSENSSTGGDEASTTTSENSSTGNESSSTAGDESSTTSFENSSTDNGGSNGNQEISCRTDVADDATMNPDCLVDGRYYSFYLTDLGDMSAAGFAELYTKVLGTDFAVERVLSGEESCIGGYDTAAALGKVLDAANSEFLFVFDDSCRVIPDYPEDPCAEEKSKGVYTTPSCVDDTLSYEVSYSEKISDELLTKILTELYSDDTDSVSTDGTYLCVTTKADTMLELLQRNDPNAELILVKRCEEVSVDTGLNYDFSRDTGITTRTPAESTDEEENSDVKGDSEESDSGALPSRENFVAPSSDSQDSGESSDEGDKTEEEEDDTGAVFRPTTDSSGITTGTALSPEKGDMIIKQ